MGDACSMASGLLHAGRSWPLPSLQVGDLLDRGDNEVAILYWLERLQQEAADAGGELHILNGNHESLNVAGRFRYATPQGMQDFLRWQTVEKIGAGLKVGPSCSTTVAQVCLASVVLQAMEKIGGRWLLDPSVGDGLMQVPSTLACSWEQTQQAWPKCQCLLHCALQLILCLQKQPAWVRSIGPVMANSSTITSQRCSSCCAGQMWP